MSILKKLREALKAAVETKKAAAISITSAVVLLTSMILLSFPNYSYQLLSTDLFYFFTAFKALSINLHESAGLTGVVLTIAYSLIGGMAVTNLIQQLKFQGAGLKNSGLLAPGIILSGCAGCGAGVLGLIGLTGALAFLPFEGNLFRLGGIVLIIYFLGKTGHPKKCDVE